jgi:hypothetical protein
MKLLTIIFVALISINFVYSANVYQYNPRELIYDITGYTTCSEYTAKGIAICGNGTSSSSTGMNITDIKVTNETTFHNISINRTGLSNLWTTFTDYNSGGAGNTTEEMQDAVLNAGASGTGTTYTYNDAGKPVLFIDIL